MGSQASIPVRSLVAIGATPEPAALASAAHALCDNGYLAEAEALARWLVHQQPHFSGGRVVLGRVLFEMERLDESADVLRATTIQYPASVAAYRWLAEVLVRQGLWARAKAVLNQAAMLSPANRRIAQLQRLAGQEGERAEVIADESTTRAMDLPLPKSRRVLPPPIPAQGLSHKERGNRLTETDATPTGVAPPETPLYARSDFDLARFDSGDLPTMTPSPEGAVHYREIETLHFENTPSVTWKGIPVLDEHWRKRWHRGAGWLGALLATGLAGFAAMRALTPDAGAPNATSSAQTLRGAPATPTPESANDFDSLLRTASPESLRSVVTAAKKTRSKEARGAWALANALLFLDYGVKSENATGTPDDSDQTLSAHALHLIAKGHLPEARALVQGATPRTAAQPWLALAQARVEQRLGNIDAARTLLGDPHGSLAASMLAAELAIDDGRAAEALRILSPFVARFAKHPRLQALRNEANDAVHPGNNAADNACAPALGPNLFARCAARAASGLRRKGLHEEAIRRAVAAAREPGTDARAMAATALVLFNLGRSESAEPLLKQLAAATGPAFRGRTWSEFASLMARDPRNAANLLPSHTPTSAEERLLVVRASYAGQGASALRGALNMIGTDAIKGDEDIRWWRMLTQYEGAAALNVSLKLLTAKRAFGPTGAFVSGLLGSDSRRVTSRWMSAALSTQGCADRCWAAQEFAKAQVNLGLDPQKLPAYANLMASGRCQ